MKVAKTNIVNLTSTEFKNLQETDKSLDKLRKKIECESVERPRQWGADSGGLTMRADGARAQPSPPGPSINNISLDNAVLSKWSGLWFSPKEYAARHLPIKPRCFVERASLIVSKLALINTDLRSTTRHTYSVNYCEAKLE